MNTARQLLGALRALVDLVATLVDDGREPVDLDALDRAR